MRPNILWTWDIIFCWIYDFNVHSEWENDGGGMSFALEVALHRCQHYMVAEPMMHTTLHLQQFDNYSSTTSGYSAIHIKGECYICSHV